MISSTPFEHNFLYGSIQPIHGTLSGTTTPGQSRLESDSNEEVYHTHPLSRTGNLLSV